MRASQLFWKDLSGWVEAPEQPRRADADLVSGQVQLGNQTMTVTPTSELAA